MNRITNLKTKPESSKVQSNNNTTHNNSNSTMKKYNPLAQPVKGFLVPGAKVDQSSRMNSFDTRKKENNFKNKSQFSKSKTNHSEEDIT